MKNVVKYYAYLDKLLMGSIYVIKYRILLESPNIRIPIILGSPTGLLVKNTWGLTGHNVSFSVENENARVRGFRLTF